MQDVGIALVVQWLEPAFQFRGGDSSLGTKIPHCATQGEVVVQQQIQRSKKKESLNKVQEK